MLNFWALRIGRARSDHQATVTAASGAGRPTLHRSVGDRLVLKQHHLGLKQHHLGLKQHHLVLN
jgi:hypothetical protein